MGKTRNTGFSNNAIQFNSGSISFTSGSTTRMFISASGFIGIGITGSTNPVRLSVSGAIESLTDGSGEGGQITLRGTTYQYGIDNYNGTGLRIFRENDGTGASGTVLMFVSASGNVGIGTVNIGGKLDVQASGTSTFSYYFRNSAGGYGGGIYNTGANNTQLYLAASGGIENVVLSSTGSSYFNGGYVGIGTTNPLTPLHISGSQQIVRINSTYALSSGYADAFQMLFSNQTAGGVSLNIGKAESSYNLAKMVYFHSSDGSTSNRLGFGFYSADGLLNILGSGNVGIGTASPGYKLEVYQDTTGYATINVRNPNATANSGASLRLYSSGYDNMPAEIINKPDATGGTLLFNIRRASGTYYDAVTFRGDGSVFINTTSNPLSNATPQFSMIAGAGTDAVSIKHTVDGNNTVNIWQTGGSSSHSALAFYKGDTQSLRGYITVSVSGTTYNSSSDYRLKENIVPLENGLARLMQLKPSKFNWIETGDESEGFIAHELQEYFPDAVTGEKDAVYSSTGNIKPQSVDYGRITPLLVKAIQELKAENDALKTRIETLENK